MINEHIVWGEIGKLSILLSFFMALFSAIIFSFSRILNTDDDKKRFFHTGQISYLLHVVALVVSSSVLVYIIFNHYFEYAYVWKYSSILMPLKYTIACFWAGQEGSFLLWGLFQSVLGVIVLFTAKRMRSTLMAIIALIQTILLSTLLGLHLGTLKIGASPFLLLRNLPENLGNNFFHNANYLSFIKDGMGLNPLLENYWMVIHPPILFLGYAAALIPFVYALASLWEGDYRQWLQSGIRWILFAVLTLFTGVLLGGAWAYESLTFGGFWAWDPVENASIVPLLFLIASLHLFLIVYRKGAHHFFAYSFTIISYVLVWYASFLTRSGILGQTSVHAFGNDGLSLHLVIINLLLLLWGLSFLIYRYKDLMSFTAFQAAFTVDFLMLIGSLILALSAFQISFTTSIPVWNKLFGLHIAPPLNATNFYNHWQTPFAFFVLILIVLSQFKLLKSVDENLFKRLRYTLLILICFCLSTTFFLGSWMPKEKYYLLFLFFAAIFTVVSLLMSLFQKKTNLKALGGIITHIGFSVFVIGIIVTFSNPQILTKQTRDKNNNHAIRSDQSIMLKRGLTVKLDDYYVVYSSRTARQNETFYQINFYKDSLLKEKIFSLSPTMKQNERMGNVYNPDTHHFLYKDIYTYISFSELSGDFQKQKANNNVINLNEFNLSSKSPISFKQSIKYDDYIITLDDVKADIKDVAYVNVDLTAHLSVKAQSGVVQHVVCKFIKRGDNYFNEDAIIDAWNLGLRFEMTSSKSDAIELGVYNRKPDFILFKAISFPWISVLWFGALLIFVGLSISLFARVLTAQKRNS
ncbi:MAG: cytochrome c biogenesis protein CcsA [Bacteroidetes bacterium]|nr:cytochrome c biogenesis protein CcsA [Bacteroidota bacterium]